jgi:hypothetical protein
MDLRGNVGLVSRQVLGQVCQLAADHRADAEDHRKGKHDHGNDGNHAVDMPTAQQQHWRPEGKTQEDGERHRDKDFPPEVERRNGNHPDGQGPQPRKRGTGGTDLRPVKVGGRKGGVAHGRSLAARAACGGHRAFRSVVVTH